MQMATLDQLYPLTFGLLVPFDDKFSPMSHNKTRQGTVPAINMCGCHLFFGGLGPR